MIADLIQAERGATTARSLSPDPGRSRHPLRLVPWLLLVVMNGVCGKPARDEARVKMAGSESADRLLGDSRNGGQDGAASSAAVRLNLRECRSPDGEVCR